MLTSGGSSFFRVSRKRNRLVAVAEHILNFKKLSLPSSKVVRTLRYSGDAVLVVDHRCRMRRHQERDTSGEDVER